MLTDAEKLAAMQTAEKLAMARQQLGHEAGELTGMRVPQWQGLTDHEREMSILDARNYLIAAKRAGLLPDWGGRECAVFPCPDPVVGAVVSEQAVRTHDGTELIRYRMHVFTCAKHGEPVQTALASAGQSLGPELEEADAQEPAQEPAGDRKVEHAGDLIEDGDEVLRQLRRVTDGWGRALRPDDPQHLLALAIARDLLAAGFELHDCAHQAPTGGVCLTPSSQDPPGVIVTWAQHDALAHDQEDGDFYPVYQEMQDTMNIAVADALGILGWHVEELDPSSATIVRRRRTAEEMAWPPGEPQP